MQTSGLPLSSLQHVKDALAHGAKLLVGGKRGTGSYYEPTILSDVPTSCVGCHCSGRLRDLMTDRPPSSCHPKRRSGLLRRSFVSPRRTRSS